MKNQGRMRGFTIVELVIVIAVIAILASIVIVGYEKVQAQANDAKMQTAAKQVVDAIKMWHARNGSFPKGGAGSSVAIGSGTECSNGLNGWFGGGTYMCTVEDSLISRRLLPSDFVRSLPPNPHYGNHADGRSSMMLYRCTGTDRYALYYALIQPSANDTSNLIAVESSGCTSTPRTNYGMRAAKIIEL